MRADRPAHPLLVPPNLVHAVVVAAAVGHSRLVKIPVCEQGPRAALATRATAGLVPLTLFPVPCHDRLQLAAVPATTARAEAVDATGRVVLRQVLRSTQPQLEKLQLAPMEPVSYKARDGLTIHGYLTTPPGIEAKNLPTVLLVRIPYSRCSMSMATWYW